MDLVDYAQERFHEIEQELRTLADRLGAQDVVAIPIAALHGDNVVEGSERMPWWSGPTLLEHLEALEIAADRNLDSRRFPVQWVIRPMSDQHHDYRGYAGQVAGGVWRAGDDVVALPSGRRTRVAAVESADGPLDVAVPGMSVAIRLEDELDLPRGDMLADPDDQPVCARELVATVCWMSERAAHAGCAARRQADDAQRPRDRRGDREHGRDGDAHGAPGRRDAAERHRHRATPPVRPADGRPLRREPRHGRVHPHRRGDERHRRRGDDPLGQRLESGRRRAVLRPRRSRDAQALALVHDARAGGRQARRYACRPSLGVESPAMADEITVLLADDHEVVREGLRLSLLRSPHIRIVGEAPDGATAVALTERRRPDVVVMDLRMPEMDGIEATEEILSRVPDAKVLIFTAYSERALLTRGLESGAKGYVLKEAPHETLLKAIEKVAAGETFVDPALMSFLTTGRDGNDILTAREREILQLLADGMSNADVAQRLFISQETVKSHVRHILTKLEADTRTQAVAIALREAMID